MQIIQHRMCEPRRASETIFTQIVSESECIAGRYAERHRIWSGWSTYRLTGDKLHQFAQDTNKTKPCK